MESIFIYENAYSLTREICEMLLIKYEEAGLNRYKGVVLSGVHKEIKDTLDLVVPFTDETWDRINKMLIKELKRNLQIYLDNFMTQYQLIICDIETIFIEPYLIQRYLKGVGKYIYHNDFNLIDRGYRLLTFIWYLNDVNEGGETEFFSNLKIKPTVGKLVIFPANWTFPHCGKMPISNNKYILTGWIYVENNNIDLQDNTSCNINQTQVSTQTEGIYATIPNSLLNSILKKNKTYYILFSTFLCIISLLLGLFIPINNKNMLYGNCKFANNIP